MIIILYASIALLVVSIIYLGYTAIKAMKNIKPKVNELNATAERVNERMNGIKTETAVLNDTKDKISEDIQYKKESVNKIIGGAKETLTLLKRVWENGKA
ncbi:DUF948 domain-containing protein [Priestia endophytica]|uniref:DUF948 domain-containing protein n=1 Tax=Priestia endophytica TaxID=135735 RepID=UPI000FC0E21A|nr:DUF948 domain-containing protein [Priestia endophytica]RPK14638.1 hypothetical protein FH5_00073 [Priestia endophytica]